MPVLVTRYLLLLCAVKGTRSQDRGKDGPSSLVTLSIAGSEKRQERKDRGRKNRDARLLGL